MPACSIAGRWKNSKLKHSTYQFNQVIAKEAIHILRLPEGLVGDGAKLYGSIAVSDIINEAKSQQQLPIEDRVPHFLLIDETKNIEHGCLVEPIAETRKYKLGFVISAQHTKQLEPELRDALIANAGTIIAYRSGQHDAELFAHEMGEFHPRRFTDLRCQQRLKVDPPQRLKNDPAVWPSVIGLRAAQ